MKIVPEEELAALALSDDIQGAMQRLQDLNMQLESKIASQTDTLNALLSDHSGLGDEHSVIKGELIHLQETSAAEIKQVTALLDEALHALMQEKCANDLHLEEEGASSPNLLGYRANCITLRIPYHSKHPSLNISTSMLRNWNWKYLRCVKLWMTFESSSTTMERTVLSHRDLARNIDQIKKLEDVQNIEVDLAAKEKSWMNEILRCMI